MKEMNINENIIIVSKNTENKGFNQLLENLTVVDNNQKIDNLDVKLSNSNKVFIILFEDFEKKSLANFVDKNAFKNAFLFFAKDTQVLDLRLDDNIIFDCLENSDSKELVNTKINYLDARLKHNQVLDKNLELQNTIDKLNLSNLSIINEAKIKSNAELLSNISHQWRQPLNSITLCASSILVENELDMLDSKKLDSYLNKIVKSSNYLSNIINEFTDKYTEVSSNSEKTNIQTELNNAIQLVSKSLENYDINLVVDFKHKNAIDKKLTKGQLSEVISSVICNSKDALCTRDIKSPWIKLELDLVDDEILISIEDNAGGINEEIISDIFSAYTTTEHKSLGKGLGLNLCYRTITEAMNGSLSVENTANGAKFIIKLNNSVDVKNLKIMYVEDDTMERTHFERILKRHIPNVKSFKNGQDALDEYIKNSDYDLIISDLTMPIMGGVELIKNIRNKNNNVPVVITSADIGSITTDDVKNLDVSSCFEKPADMVSVLNSIKEIMKKGDV